MNTPAGDDGSRAWRDPADTRLMQALVSRCWTHDWPAVRFHPGDLDWWTVHAFGRDPGLEGRIRLWFTGQPDATELVAFGWFGPPEELDFVIAPSARGGPLVADLVDWVDERIRTAGSAETLTGRPAAGGTASPRIWMRTAADPATAALEELGFWRSDDPGFVHFTGPAEETASLAGPVLPSGYALRTIDSEDDVASRVACGHAAFPGSTMTIEKYRFCQSTALYRSALDTIVVDRDGRVAAFALGWLDPVTLAVELEPVGVHPDHQRRGLGSAVCLAALRAARAMGARQAVIAAAVSNPAAIGLYASLGLEVTAEIVAYRRPPA